MLKRLTEYIAAVERRLDGLNDRFNNRPELQQLKNLQDALSQSHQQFSPSSTSLEAAVDLDKEPTQESNYQEEVQQPVVILNQTRRRSSSIRYSEEIQQQPMQEQSYESQLVFDRSGSRAVLIEALEKAQRRLIIVCPWLRRNSIDVIQKFKDCFNRNCRIDIGWGYFSEPNKTGIGKGNSVIRELR